MTDEIILKHTRGKDGRLYCFINGKRVGYQYYTGRLEEQLTPTS